MITARTTYHSNTVAVKKDFDRRMGRAVRQASHDAARWAESRSGGAVNMQPQPVEDHGSVLSARVTASPADFYAIMLDKGTLSKRRLPLKYPGKRKSSWKSKRTRKFAGTPGVARSGATKTGTFTAHRSAQALASGGARPRYFMVRGKRYGQQKLARYVNS